MRHVCGVVLLEKKEKDKIEAQRTLGGLGGKPAAARQAWHTLNPEP